MAAASRGTSKPSRTASSSYSHVLTGATGHLLILGLGHFGLASLNCIYMHTKKYKSI